jgi:hypothetical protein
MIIVVCTIYTNYTKGILVEHQNEVLLQMQAQTIREDSIRETMRNGYGEVRQFVIDAFRAAGISEVTMKG